MAEPADLAVLALLGCVLALAALLVWSLGRPSRRARSRGLRAVQGEEDAARLLRRLGYQVEERQLAGEIALKVDGQEERFDLRADYLVYRGGRSWIAEVKTGEKATRLSHGPTRRQLLEYALAFEVDGVLLVCPEEGCVYEVEFPPPGRSRAAVGAWVFGLGVVAGLLLAGAWARLV